MKAPAITQGQNTFGGLGSASPVAINTPSEEKQREWKAEQEADVGGADRPESCGQLALHGVARGLRRRGDQRKDGPEHFLSIVMRALDPRIHDGCPSASATSLALLPSSRMPGQARQ